VARIDVVAAEQLDRRLLLVRVEAQALLLDPAGERLVDESALGRLGRKSMRLMRPVWLQDLRRRCCRASYNGVSWISVPGVLRVGEAWTWALIAPARTGLSPMRFLRGKGSHECFRSRQTKSSRSRWSPTAAKWQWFRRGSSTWRRSRRRPGSQGVAHSGFDEVVVDLRRLTFIDSSGAADAAAPTQRGERDGHHLTLVPGSPRVQRIFELTSTRGLFDWRFA
jgi:hypothetical protein